MIYTHVLYEDWFYFEDPAIQFIIEYLRTLIGFSHKLMDNNNCFFPSRKYFKIQNLKISLKTPKRPVRIKKLYRNEKQWKNKIGILGLATIDQCHHILMQAFIYCIYILPDWTKMTPWGGLQCLATCQTSPGLQESLRLWKYSERKQKFGENH